MDKLTWSYNCIQVMNIKFMKASYKIPKNDFQFLIPFLVCLICFAVTEFFENIDKINFAYWSGGLFSQPYRIITTHFIHSNINHLLANAFGIVVARFCLKSLSLKSDSFFLLLVSLLIPIQSLILGIIDIYLFKNPMSIAIGFSGIIYGVNGFILLTSIYGKKHFLGLNINLKKEKNVRQIMIVLIILGICWSLFPNISLLGHLSGLISGAFLFLL